MQFWGLKSCDTCKKAQKALTAAGLDFTVRDVRADGVDRSDLQRFFEALGQDLINRRSTTWRGLSDDERAKDPVDLLQAHPTLMKRPVIESDAGGLTLGWNETVLAQHNR